MEKNKRTVTCGELTAADTGRSVTLNGWVHRLRDHGGVKFINLRDRYGITQVVVDEDAAEEVRRTTEKLHNEYCIAVTGVVRGRPEEMKNPEMGTGEVEVAAESVEVLATCETLPFPIDEKSEAREELRQKFRYLDLRSFSMQRKIRLRSDVATETRKYLTGRGFLEIETPTLIRSTPEGARDFLVPSRINQGRFYALPQSPQLFKQLLMVSGFDRYFQLAHCFRDEDARGDRQVEHTQIDIEMSFVSKDDVFEVVEGMMAHIFKETLGVDVPIPFPRLGYHDAMNRYGSDKPDLRYGLEMVDVSSVVAESDFQVFKKVVASGGVVKALRVSGGQEYSRKQIDGFESVAKDYGAKGLAWTRVIGEAGSPALDGGVSRFLEKETHEILAATEAAPGDLLLFMADGWKTACTALGAVRREIGKSLIPEEDKSFSFAWIIDFPLFEWNDDEKRWEAAHHMFTMPQEPFIDTLEENPGDVKGDLYDLVCNGLELASGSIRIHDPKLQQRVFNVVGMSEEEAKRRFGFLLEAFGYGPPPHGGIAPGLDRLVMLMAGENTIREVMAFPKNSLGASPMDDSPSTVDERQLEELGIRVVAPPEEEPKGQAEPPA